MSESKRFKCVNNDRKEYDFLIYDRNVELVNAEVVDLLNSLAEENEQLRKTMNEVIELLVEEVVDLLNELVKDNEELGISIKLFEDDIATKDKKIEEQQAEIERLEKEIERLNGLLFGTPKEAIE